MTFVERFANIKVMKVKLSDKYQVVIPKEAREKMNLKRGGLNYMTVKRVTDSEITFVKSPRPGSGIEKYAGIAKGAWGEHPVAELRKQRDEEWDL